MHRSPRVHRTPRTTRTPVLSRSPILFTHALELTARCSILEKELTCNKTVDSARGWWVGLFSIQWRKNKKTKQKSFNLAKGPQAYPVEVL